MKSNETLNLSSYILSPINSIWYPDIPYHRDKQADGHEVAEKHPESDEGNDDINDAILVVAAG